MGIGDNLGASFEYAKEALLGKWVRWILLAFIGIIPIVQFILYGYMVRVLRGIKPAPELGDYLQLFIDGLLYFIIALIWMIPAFIVAMIIGFVSDGIVAMLIAFIVAILCGLFAYIGIVRFARMEKFGEAFAFGAIMEKIAAIGWVNYILALIVLGVVIGVVVFILMLIPIVGWILLFILMPFFVILQARYISNLYDSA